LKARTDKVELVEELLSFFGVASPEAWNEMWSRGKEATAFRTSPTHNSAELGLTATWLRQGELQGRDVKCEAFDAVRFKSALTQIRPLTRHRDINGAVRSAIEACAAAGVALVMVPEFPKLGVCGATRWLSPEKALIQLSLHYKRDDQLWFSLFHEAGHILVHGKRDIFVEQKKAAKNAEEEEANKFAADFLIPPESYRHFVSGGDFIHASIANYAASLEIAPSIVVGRLQHDKVIGFGKLNEFRVRIDWARQP
jgi:hypothetical protein